MKWIKTFEELTPKIYRQAGQSLMYIPHKKERGMKLKDYGSEKEWGIYNIELVRNYDDNYQKVKFTKPKAKFILNHKVTPEALNNMNTLYEDISVEEMLDLWRDGERELYFTIQFYFDPIEETKDNYLGRYLSGWEQPVFSFKVNIANLNSGLEEWNNPEEWEEEDPPKQYTLQELYDDCHDLVIDLTIPQVNPRSVWNGHNNNTQYYHYGIFSDRNSAFRFKKLLPSLIDDEIQEKIWGVFSLLGDSQGFKKCIHALKYGLRINYLYDDTNTIGRSDFKNPSKWFRHNIASVTKELPKKEEEPKQLEEPKEEPKQMWYQSRT
jgi:hypothetical protein